MPASFQYQEQPGANRTTWTTNADTSGNDFKWWVRNQGSGEDHGPYTPLRHLGTDGNIWHVYLRTEVVSGLGPDGKTPVPYVIKKFDSHREDNGGNNTENWIAIVDWNGDHWKVEPEYATFLGNPVSFKLTKI